MSGHLRQIIASLTKIEKNCYSNLTNGYNENMFMTPIEFVLTEFQIVLNVNCTRN